MCSIYQELDKQGLCENSELCLKVINQLKSCLKKRRTGIPYGVANLTLGIRPRATPACVHWERHAY